MTMLRQISTVILLLSINLLAILAQGPIEGVTSSYTITSGGVPYNYLVYSPPWITRPQGAPLFVFLHGCTQTAEDFMTGVDAKDLADSLQAILLFPEQSTVNNEMRCWNWFLPHNHARDGEPKAIVDMIRAVQNRAPMPKPSHPTKLRSVAIDSSRIYVAGFGAGGALANTLGSVYPDVFAAIGSHSGIAYRAASDAEKAMQIQVDGHPYAMTLGQNIFTTHQVLMEIEKPTPMPIIILHGRSDLLNRDINSEQMVRIWLLHNHLALQAKYQTHNPASEAATSDDPLVQEAARETEFRPFSPAYSRPQFVTKGKSEFGRGITVRKYFDLTDGYNPLVEHWRVASLGHAWSGGSPAGSHTNFTSVSATTAIFEFFLRHKKNS